MPDTGSGIVYHYCSLEAFKSIIENKCLWLCDVQKSNDSAECRVLPNAIADELERRFHNHQSQLPYLTLADKEYSRLLSILRNETDICNQQVYSISFSLCADQLSQWRGYANDGTGICIGFNSAYLNDLSAYGFMFRHISYDQTALSDTVEQYTSNILNFLKHLPSIPAPKDITSEQLKAFQESNPIIASVQQHAPFFKLAPFYEENESRLCFLANHIMVPSNSILFQSIDQRINQHLSNNKWFSISPLQFRVTSSDLQSYYKLHFATIKDTFIQEIIIGPKSPVKISDIYLLLSANGYNVKISQQNISMSFFSDSLQIRKSALTYR